jgi:hypothetical protein
MAELLIADTTGDDSSINGGWVFIDHNLWMYLVTGYEYSYRY